MAKRGTTSRRAVRRELLAESRKHLATRLLRQIPAIGPIRAALLIAILQTPHPCMQWRGGRITCCGALKAITGW